MRLVGQNGLLVEVEGAQPCVQRLVDRLSASARVYRLNEFEIVWMPPRGDFATFHVSV
jgi:hypothetical protein